MYSAFCCNASITAFHSACTQHVLSYFGLLLVLISTSHRRWPSSLRGGALKPRPIIIPDFATIIEPHFARKHVACRASSAALSKYLTILSTSGDSIRLTQPPFVEYTVLSEIIVQVYSYSLRKSIPARCIVHWRNFQNYSYYHDNVCTRRLFLHDR